MDTGVVMLSVIYAECSYAQCHYAECHCAECRGAKKGFLPSALSSSWLISLLKLFHLKKLHIVCTNYNTVF